MPVRSFSLNSREFTEACCRREYSELPREPNFPSEPEPLLVMAKTEAEAGTAFKEWLGHVEAGSIG